MEKAVPEYVEALALYRLNQKYDMKEYTKESIIFTRKVKSYKERFTAYYKYPELFNDKELMKHINKDDLKNANNTLRCEQNITSFARLREILRLKDSSKEEKRKDGKLYNYPSLKEALQSKAKSNFNVFCRITESGLPEIFEEYKNTKLKLYQIEKEDGRKRIIKDCNYDMKLIEKFIKLHIKGNITNYRKGYQLLLAKMLEEERNKGNTIILPDTYKSYIDEIKSKLQLAV